MLYEFGLTRLRDAPAMALSGGERRRAEIARALAANPSIMLLDDPFAGIEPLYISDRRDLIKDLQMRGIGGLNRYAQAVSAGEPVPPPRPRADEIGDLGRALETMRRKLAGTGLELVTLRGLGYLLRAAT